ncbi:MAG: diguanylate cyclase, partial [Gemmatimonadota bacterium]
MTVNPIKVLVVTPTERDVRRLQGVVVVPGATHVELAHVLDVGAAVRRLSDTRFDAILLDLAVAHTHPLEPLWRMHEHAPDVPIIVLTSMEDEALAVRALKAGAQDSLVKGQIDGNLLTRAIRYAIERHQLQMALHAMSLIDDLTGLYNRRGFLTLARQHLKMADRLRKRVSHIFVDLDGLKRINDTMGHRHGDQALVETAEMLKETFRESDIVARIGGDEFVVLAMDNAAGLLEETWQQRVQDNLAQRNGRPGRSYQLSVSMGVAYYDPDFPTPLDDLLARADTLMYEEKRAKREP